MYYRRKLIMALLQEFGGRVGNAQFQILLMLLTKKQEKPDFHFVPYRYGCYSFQAAADVASMYKHGRLEVTNMGIAKRDADDYLYMLKRQDKEALGELRVLHSSRRCGELVTLAFSEFPYYAIKSPFLERYLDEEAIMNVKNAIPVFEEKVLHTIGYEGMSPEEYLNSLIAQGVRTLIDVRHSPKSMKFGFSRSQLKKACEWVGIEYLHMPELGIEPDKRKGLKNQDDYEQLFEQYRKEISESRVEGQRKILEVLGRSERIALTCFEADIRQCHRRVLAEELLRLESSIVVKHI